MSSPGFCRLEFCSFPADLVCLGPVEAALFCERHLAQFLCSPEGGRAKDWGSVGVQSGVVAALVDWRTRVELEHRRDRDPQVIEARKWRPK